MKAVAILLSTVLFLNKSVDAADVKEGALKNPVSNLFITS